MKDFNYCAPTRVIFGKNTELEVGKALKNAGATRVLMQYGGGSIKKSGLYDRVVKAIRDEGIELFELGGVQPNPHLSLVRKAIEIVREQKIDYLLAVGGGSVIDQGNGRGCGVRRRCLGFLLRQGSAEKGHACGCGADHPRCGFRGQQFLRHHQ